MSALRDELQAEAVAPPAFDVLLPPGWVCAEPTRERLHDMLARASDALRSAHRPDLDASLRVLADQAWTELARRDPVRMIYPADVEEAEFFPLTILVARLTAPRGETLDLHVAELIAAKGAHPLDPEALIMRWETEGSRRLEGASITTRSFHYLVAIPGTGRRQALVFTGTLPTGADGVAADEETAAGARALMNAIMSTFEWRP